MKRLSINSPAKHAKGFTLLEVLISMVILAVGLFGLASLQTISLRSNSSAYQRSFASMLAYDIIDRMRLNYKEASTASYDGTFAPVAASGVTVPDYLKLCIDTTASPPPTCTAKQWTAYDLWEWARSDNKLAQLPNAQANITTSKISSSGVDIAINVTVTITWSDFSYRDAEGQRGAEAESFVYSSIIRI